MGRKRPEWQSRLISELEGSMPRLNENIKNAPIPEVEKREKRGFEFIFNKKLIAATASALALVLTVVSVILFATGTPTPDVAEGGVCIVEINPRVALITDSDGIVTGVRALNSDADVLVGDGALGEAVMGKALDSAAAICVDEAVRLGYFDPAGDSVRISLGEGIDKDAIADGIISSLSESGIFAAVLAEQMDAVSLSARIGEECESLDELYRAVKGYSESFSDRKTLTMTDDEIKSEYERAMSEGEVARYVSDRLSRAADLLVSHSLKLAEISVLCEKIITHPDNPVSFIFIGADYWTLRDGEYETEGELLSLMTEMESALYEYEQTFSVSIDSFVRLEELVSTYTPEHAEATAAIIRLITADSLSANLGMLAEMLSAIGFSTEVLELLADAPATREGYIERMTALIESEREERIESFRERYETERDSIDSAAYDAFIEGIIEEYGSLENYFLNKS